jgi:hypothetical protein
VNVLVDDAHCRLVVQRDRANITTTLHKAHYVPLGASALTVRLSRLPRRSDCRIVGLYRLAGTAEFARVWRWSHGEPDAMAEVPCGLHAAAKHPLKQARRDAFLAGAKQVDSLEPHPQGKVTILENRTLAHRKVRATAGVALTQPNLRDAFWMPLAGLAADAFKSADLVGSCAAMRAYRAGRPQLPFDVLKRSFLTEEPGIGKDGLGHG